MRHARQTCAAILGAALALTVLPAFADGPPTLDIEKTCRSAASANVGISDKTSEEGCLRSERDAHAEAKRRWGDYSTSAKSQCAKQFEAGGYPSYVEMVTCLELASGTVPTQPGGDAAKGTSPTEAGTLTKEAPANQRTNPIEVLDKP